MRTFVSILTVVWCTLGVCMAQPQADTAIFLQSVEIKDTRIISTVPSTILSLSDLQPKLPADVGRIFRMIPNAAGVRRGGYALDPVIRGFRNAQLNIVLDGGIQIEGGCPNRMDPVLAHIEPEEIDTLEVIPGPYLLSLGQPLGSSIRVVTRKPPTDQKTIAEVISGAGLNPKGTRQHFALSGAAKNISYRISGGYKQFGAYTDGEEINREAGFEKYNFNLIAGYRALPGHELLLSYRSNMARNVMFPALPMDEVADNTHIISLNFTQKKETPLPRSLYAMSYFSSVYHEMDNSFRPQYSRVVPPYSGLMQSVAAVHSRTAGASLNNKINFGMVELETGFDMHYRYKNGTRDVSMEMSMDDNSYVSKRSANLWHQAATTSAGIFSSYSAARGPLRFSLAGRADLAHLNSTDTFQLVKSGAEYFVSRARNLFLWSLAGNAFLPVSSSLTLHLGLGRSMRAPDLQESYIKFLSVGFDRYDYLGNPKLLPEVNHQADIRISGYTSKVEFHVQAFGSVVRNFISGVLLPPAVARPQSMGAPGVKQFTNIDRAYLWGFEGVAHVKNILGFGARFSAGYTHGTFSKTEKPLLVNNQAVGSNLITNDPIPEIPPLEAEVRINRVMGNSGAEIWTEVKMAAAQHHVSQAGYEDPTPGFFLMNAGLAWQLFTSLQVVAGVDNLFDAAYYQHLNRRMIGSADRLNEPGRSFYLNLMIKF